MTAALTVSTLSTPASSETARNQHDRLVAAANDHAAQIEAIKVGGIPTANLPQIVGDATLAVGVQAATDIDVTIQLKDLAGTNTAVKTAARMWLSDVAAGAPTAAAPDGGVSVQTGVQLVAETAGKVIDVLSDATGVIVVRLTHAGAGDTTWYVNVMIGSVVKSSAAVLIHN